MNEQNLNEFEALLCCIRPTDPSVSTGKIMYEAGRIEGTRQQISKQPSSLRMWQLATVCSLLVAGGMFVNQTPKSNNHSMVVHSPSQVGSANVNDQSESFDTPSSSPTRLTSVDTERSTIARSAVWQLLSAKSNSTVPRRQMVLQQGVAGLPEPSRSVDSYQEESGNRHQIIQQLLADELLE